MSTPGSTIDDFEIVGVRKSIVTPSKELLAEVASVGWTDWAYYKEQKTLDVGIRRRTPMANDERNLCKHANAIRRFINCRTEVYVLDFIPNHEQTSGARVVVEVGETCLINEIRMALNGVMCRQVRGLVYELHAVNNTPVGMDITTGHIVLKDGSPHDNFPPTIKLGRLEPASELHIGIIYMRPGRGFTKEVPTFENGEIVMPSDHTCYLHNGLTKWRQPDMIDVVSGAQLRDVMLESPHLIEIGFHPQPYIDPSDIFMRALQQLADDFKAVAGHIEKARQTFAAAPEEANEYAFGDVTIKCSGDNLLVTTIGFDESIGTVIASNAHQLAVKTATHYSSHVADIAKKEVIIRISAPDVLDLFGRSVELAIARTESLMRQFAAADR